MFSAPTEGIGMSQHYPALAHPELWWLKMDADSSNNAQVEKNGTKIHGAANAHPMLSGTEFTASPTSACLAKNGTKLRNHATALEEKF